MKSIFNILKFSIVLMSIFNMVNAQTNQNVSSWPHGITYEIFVQSFADSDGDGIGDINGMTSKLDYLQDLGIEGIWLMPIGPSDTYHKYNVDDYYDIHPDYGTLDDFKRFVDEAHKRGIHVVIDLVINHSGYNNIWFQEALKDQNSKYWDYYVWAHKDDPKAQPPVSDDGNRRRRRSNWNTVEGSDYLYFAHFGRNMPDLNYDNPLLQQEMFKAGKFWLEEIGVDGFRLDAARHIFPDNRAFDNHAWWEYFLQEMKKVKEDVYIVGEVWASSDIVAPYLKGIPALFNFDMGSAIIEAVNEENANGLIEKHKGIIDFYTTVNPDYVDCTFLTNHDQNRILSSVDDNIDKAKIAAALLFTLPGSPYIYYGEEIGMLGKKPDQMIREPYIWNTASKDKYRTSWEEPEYSLESTVVPMEVQEMDTKSILNHYKSLIDLRNRSSALTYGRLEYVDAPGNPAICTFIRTDDQESLLVIHNLSDEKQVFNVTSKLQEYNKLYYANNDGGINKRLVEIPEYSTVILKK
ncbi:MAG: alpha-amylase family glycosyl hydrolase [Bacteroidales bacterium]|nr:alpha-amylase family glycosyl hydrolase [Bacteroidales bacterium]